MVDVKKISLTLKKIFRINGEYEIDLDTGVIYVQGDVHFKKRVSEIPVQFGKVSGDFTCAHAGLTTLKGSPREVVGLFSCGNNKLINLQGAPEKVGQSFFCGNNPLINLVGAPHYVGYGFYTSHAPLQSLQGLPESSVYVEITYNEQLPLLRLLQHADFLVRYAPAKVVAIMKKYAGTGRAGALKAAAELVREGYTENARW